MPVSTESPIALAAHVRQTAETIRGLATVIKEIAQSDPWPTIAEATQRLNPTKIELDFENVVRYVGRKWTPAHASDLRATVHKATKGAHDFLRLFEYCARVHGHDPASLNMMEGAAYNVVCQLVAATLDGWAPEIEDQAGGEARTSPGGGQGGERVARSGVVLGLLHEQYVAPIIVGIVLLVIVGVAIWKWPWIKELLG